MRFLKGWQRMRDSSQQNRKTKKKKNLLPSLTKREFQAALGKASRKLPPKKQGK
jgi:hypothetical protein